jgi:hypothetical protein
MRDISSRASTYLKKGDYDRHMAETLAHAECAGAPAQLLEDLRRLYNGGGRPAIVSYALEQAPPYNPPALPLALLFGEAGDLDRAFRHLDRAMEARDPCLVDLAIAPQWDWLRERFTVQRAAGADGVVSAGAAPALRQITSWTTGPRVPGCPLSAKMLKSRADSPDTTRRSQSRCRTRSLSSVPCARS